MVPFKMIFFGPPLPLFIIRHYSLTHFPHVTDQKVTNLSFERQVMKYILVLDASHHKLNHKHMVEEINKKNI